MLYSGILFSHKKESVILLNEHNTNEPWKHSNCKKADTKGHLLHTIYMKFPKQVNPQRQKK